MDLGDIFHQGNALKFAARGFGIALFLHPFQIQRSDPCAGILHLQFPVSFVIRDPHPNRRESERTLGCGETESFCHMSLPVPAGIRNGRAELLAGEISVRVAVKRS